MHHGEHWYEAHLFFGYCLYPPLFLTGPTLTFNDFVCQVRHARRPSVRCYLQAVDVSLIAWA
jgi:D-alanyl-lipoteichoic acid acyltransferase DltB (MBOAT superfamily)